jgi:hypothetical protein
MQAIGSNYYCQVFNKASPDNVLVDSLKLKNLTAYAGAIKPRTPY